MYSIFNFTGILRILLFQIKGILLVTANNNADIIIFIHQYNNYIVKLCYWQCFVYAHSTEWYLKKCSLI